MAYGSERSVMLAAGVDFLRGLGRVTTAFSCLFVTYLVSDIPNGVGTDADFAVAAPAQASAAVG